MTNVVKYEKETCGRCGGYGKFSYNQIDGSRCYGCRGSGERLTKRGKAARAYATSILEKPVEDIVLEPGQFAIYTNMGLYGSGRRIKVAEIREKTEGPCAYRILENGERKPIRDFDLIDTDSKVVGVVSEGIKLRLTPTSEQIEEITAYQNNLTKAGKPSKLPKRATQFQPRSNLI